MNIKLLLDKKQNNKKSLIKGRWQRTGRFFKKYKILIYADVNWKLAKITKYRKAMKRSNPFLRNRRLKCFMAYFLCTDFHEIVHIKMNQWGIKDPSCKNNACSDGECWWCDYTNYKLHWFFVERGIEI
jgi:hypothetical protein